MKPSPSCALTSGWHPVVAAAGMLGCAVLISLTIVAGAYCADAAKPLTAAAEQGVRWQDLKPAQQAALKPLEHEWSRIDGPGKKKWLEVSARFQKFTPAEQTRMQDRMTQWTKLTPLERGQARLHFQEAKEVPAKDRQARWNAYQALSPEQKRDLAARAAPPSDASRKSSGAAPARSEGASRETPQLKSNIVPNPTFAAPPKAIAPTVVQARPGASTTSITKRPTPPTHQQPGMPKIAATPGFVNKATLLPQRGPQGAATRAATAPADNDRSPQR
jgi:hypothetical protein